MKNKPILLCSLLGVLLPVAAFSLMSGRAVGQTADESAPTVPSQMPDKIITETEAGKTVKVQIGQRLLVRLPSNPTTGYEWSVVKTDDKILASDDETEFDAPTNDMPGAPTVQTLFFRAKSAGKVALELGYARPWETDKAPIKTYKVSVEIVK